MPDIKTRDLVKGTIKTLDKAVVTSERMKQAYIQTKDKSTESVSSQDYSPEDYASTKIEGAVESTVRETTHQFVNLGKKAMNKTKMKLKDTLKKSEYQCSGYGTKYYQEKYSFKESTSSF